MITLVEAAGSVNWIDLLWNNVKLRGYAPPHEVLRAGESAYIDFNPEKASIFDAHSGKRLE